jgi:putative DNA primase/helicase
MGFVSSWRTTSNGLEPLLASHNDGTVFLDEISQADPRAIAELIYTASNNTGKNRMTRDLKAAPTPRWRVMILSTGETTLAAHARRAQITLPGGAAVRIIDIPADSGKGS